MSAPDWAPKPEQVAAYVTSRTVDMSTPGSDEPAQTFTSGTTPSLDQVTQLIDDACAWVTMVAGPIASSLSQAAASVAALRAAGMVELSYPVRNADVDAVSNPLLQQARFARDELAAANRAAGEAGPNTTAAPQFSFPDPVTWRADEPVRPLRSYIYVQ